MLIAVGSKNPVKVAAVAEAFSKIFPEEKLDIVSYEVASNVRSQPFGDEEALTGCENRIENLKELAPEADYRVGIEGTIDTILEVSYTYAWGMVANKSGQAYAARTVSIPLPEEVMTVINSGVELGQAIDQVFHKENSKQHEGAMGILSFGHVSRGSTISGAILLALTAFKSRKQLE
jgi:inosine/xanthosine triphosphatase